MLPDMGLGDGLPVVLTGPFEKGPPTLSNVLGLLPLLLAEGAGAGVGDTLGPAVALHLVVPFPPG